MIYFMKFITSISINPNFLSYNYLLLAQFLLQRICRGTEEIFQVQANLITAGINAKC